jgi:hypothetical protein
VFSSIDREFFSFGPVNATSERLLELCRIPREYGRGQKAYFTFLSPFTKDIHLILLKFLVLLSHYYAEINLKKNLK